MPEIRQYVALASGSDAEDDFRRLSIVIPVYCGAKTVAALVERLVHALATHFELEIVLVNDGSHDDSAEVCRRLALSRREVRFVNLSRNFGEHNAVMAGLNHCTGDGAVIMDDDFQNPPEEVFKLVNELRHGHDVVFSYYDVKHHSLWRNLGSWFANAIAVVMLRKPRDLYLSSFKAINRFLIDEIIKYNGPFPYIDGLILRVTSNYARVRVAHDPRAAGKSGYTFVKLVSLWMNMFTNFSILPLRLASYCGFFCAAVGVLIAAAFAFEKWSDPTLPVGWASLIVSVLLIGGMQLFAMGMIGEYLGRLFLKDNGRPQFVVRETIGTDRDAQPATVKLAA